MSLLIKKLNKNLNSLLDVKEALLQFDENKIDKINWSDYPYKPDVSFWIAWNEKGIYLHYKVNEKHILANQTSVYSKAYLDSCVEFFFSPDSNSDYYNLEVNCVGSILFHKKFGGEKFVFPQSDILKIETMTSLPKYKKIDNTEGGEWEITIFIHSSLFSENFLKSGKEFTANFYKCGDDTLERHFVSWSEIQSELPAFHKPEFFSKVILE